MEFIKKYINYFILAVIVFLLILLLIINITKEKEIIKTFKNNGMITVKIYTNKNENKILSKIENKNSTNEIVSVLEKNGIDKYIINNNGIITAGHSYSDEKYSVSIIKDGKVKDIVLLLDETLYVIEEDDILVCAISKEYEDAKTIAKNAIKNKTLDENKKVYMINGNEKSMTKSFKKYIKK